MKEQAVAGMSMGEMIGAFMFGVSAFIVAGAWLLKKWESTSKKLDELREENLNKDLSSLKDSVGSVKYEVDRVEKSVVKIDTRMESFDKRIDQLNSITETLRKDISDTRKMFIKHDWSGKNGA